MTDTTPAESAPHASAPEIRPASSLNLRSLSQRIARLDHYYQARFRNRFGPLVDALSRWIPQNAVVLDIGANHGKMTRPLSRLPGVAVHAFEPVDYNFTLLHRVTRGLPNVTRHRFALSDSNGQVSIYIPVRPSQRISPGAAHMGDTAHADTFGTSTAHAVAELIINTDTLDAVVEREKLSSVDFMKIDVEGAESLVIAGGQRTIAAHKPAIYCEISDRCGNLGKTPADTIGPLQAMGYRLFAFNEKHHTARELDAHDPAERDYLFLHPDRHGWS
ncbi:MAG: FkbM family methyltransferase [Planctomycetota bacterium]